MVRLTFAMVVSVAAVNLGTVAAVTASPKERITRADPLLENWEKEEDLANLLSDMIASSKSASPTATNEPSISPTYRPSLSPTSLPSESPSQYPTLTPTTSPSYSSQPTGQPSSYPTASPSISPTMSAFPSTSPSLQPTLFPSMAPSISQLPTSTPSYQPSVTPSAAPTSTPSSMPSTQPSLPPTTLPSLSPSQSVSPSQSPTKVTMLTSGIVIDQSKTKRATPLLIVGACCFIVMASTSAYLFSRGNDTRKRKRERALTTTYDVTSPQHGAKRIISPFDVEGELEQQRGIYSVNYSESESGVSDANTLEYGDDAKNAGGFEDVETGRIGIDAVPNSVSIIKRNQSSDAPESTCLGTTDENEQFGNSKLRMPKSIYVPKLFQRTKEGDEGSKQIVTWNSIREEDRSPASSGYAPASVPSQMLSPFFVKGLSSILSPYKGIRKRGVPMNETCDDEDGVTSDATNDRFTHSHLLRNDKKSSSGGVKSEILSPSSDVFADIDNAAIQTIVSKSSDGSSIEWGIDVSKVQPSKAVFNDSAMKQRNMSHVLDNVCGKKASIAEESATSTRMEVPMTYTDDSWENRIHQDADLNSLQSNGSTFLGDIHVASTEQATFQSSKIQKGSRITFERELLRANRLDSGAFSFRNIFNDPKNDLYECHAPSGPLGIVVDTTPLGPRVRSLNPLSPIFGKLSPGDVIVGVDEVDTVGMEAGDFWQIVSRKANQQRRILTILRI